MDDYQSIKEQIDRIEHKLDQVIEFNALVAEAAAPFLTGKGGKWLALIAKTKGPRT